MRKFYGADYSDYYIEETRNINVCGGEIKKSFSIKVAFYILWFKFYSTFGHGWDWNKGMCLKVQGDRWFSDEKFDSIELASKRYKEFCVRKESSKHIIDVCQVKEIVIVPTEEEHKILVNKAISSPNLLTKEEKNKILSYRMPSEEVAKRISGLS